MSSYTGSCACGAVQYTINDDLQQQASICHCTTCQAWSGGVFLYVASKNVQIRDPERNVQIWKSSEWAERAFCRTCGSALYCRITAEGPMHGEYHVAAGTLTDWKDIQLQKEIFVDRKPAGYSFQEDTQKMTADEIFALWTAAASKEEGK